MPVDKKLNLVFWAFPSWSDEYMKSTMELAKELAVYHNVLYIDYAYTIKDILGARAESAIPTKSILGKDNGLQKIKLANGADLFLLSLPPVVPFNWTSNKKIYKAIETVNYLIVSKRIKQALKQLDFEADFIINAFNPFFTNTSKKIFSKQPFIYYCYDNIDAAAWAAKHGARLEKETIKMADAVIFTSDTLRADKAGATKSFVVSNGADLRAFEKFLLGPPTNNKPVVGYTGCIDNRLDYELLEDVIAQNTQLDFQFIGPVTDKSAEKLKRFTNVKFIGAVKPTQLAEAMKPFNAGIIPFVKNDFTRNIYPMKANEYLAMGIPVIATDFAQLNDLNNYLEIAYNSTEFSHRLNQSLGTDSEIKQQERKLKARQNSWQQKALEFEKILMSCVN